MSPVATKASWSLAATHPFFSFLAEKVLKGCGVEYAFEVFVFRTPFPPVCLLGS